MAITDNLVAWWTMDEASGNRADDTGRGNTLVDHNTVGSTTLWGDTVADFVMASSEYFTLASNSDVALGDSSFTIAAEVQFDSTVSGTTQIVLAKYPEYKLWMYGSQVRFSVWTAGPTEVTLQGAYAFGTPSKVFILAVHDADTDTMYLRVNNETVSSRATGGSLAGNAGNSLYVGNDYSLASTFFDGKMRRVAIWQRALSTAEQDLIINGAAGVDYPITATVAYTDIGTLVSNDGYYGGDADNGTNAVTQNNTLKSVTVGGTDYQAVCYWDTSGNLVIGRRTLPSGSWTLYTMDGSGGRPSITAGAGAYDSHYYPAIGIDKDGHIHASYAMHDDSLLYAKSDSPISSWTGGMSTGLSMLGTNESEVTYPTFFNDPSGKLYFMFRDGVSGNGNLYLYSYDESTGWASATGTTAGLVINGKSTPQSPYWSQPAFDATFGSGGYMHLFFWWYNDDDLAYVKWDGTNWKQADGTSQTIPITPANDDLVGSSIGNYANMSCCVDSSGYPHVVWKDGGVADVYHTWHNGTAWQTPVNLIDGWENPVIAIWYNSQVNVITTQVGGGIVRSYASSPYTSWSSETLYNSQSPRVYANVHVSFNPDYSRWMSDNVLDMRLTCWQTNMKTGWPLRIMSWSPSDIYGDADITLSGITMSAAGTVAGSISGLIAMLDDLTLSGSGFYPDGLILDDITASMAGTIAMPYEGVAATLDDLTIQATYILPDGLVLDDLTLSSVGVSTVHTGVLDKTLDDLTLSSTGGLLTGNGALTATLDDVSTSMTGAVTVQAALTASLDDLSASITGTVAVIGALKFLTVQERDISFAARKR